MSPDRVRRVAHEAMGTIFEALIADADEAYALQAAQAVFAEVDRIERLFSRFDPGSEISQINRLPAGETMAIGIETYDCLSRAEKVRRDTLGAFDVRFGIAASPNLDLIRSGTGFAVRVPSGDARIDLGGIGKGYALDRAAFLLADWGIGCALIHGGTSTALAIGEAEWPVATGFSSANPFRLRAGALSGSGTEVKGGHIIDPRTGQPAQGRLAAWAYHPLAAEADALSTAFMVMGPETVEEYCSRYPHVWARQIDDQGRTRTFTGHLGKTIHQGV